MSDFAQESKHLRNEIMMARNKHYATSRSGLVKPNSSPNENPVWHFYNTGKITYQKGGWAYMRRGESIVEPEVIGWEKTRLDFGEGTYVILTENECAFFRNKMIELLKKK